MTDSFWKERYDVMREEYDLVLKENAYLFSQVREIKAHASLGDIVSAITGIKALVERLDRCTPNNYTNKPQVKVSQEGGYKWKSE